MYMDTTDKIIDELQKIGITATREEIEQRRKELRKKLELMKKSSKGDKGAMMELVDMSLDENKIIFDRLAEL